MLPRLTNGLAKRFGLGFLESAGVGGVLLPIVLPLVFVSSGCTEESSQDSLPPADAGVDHSVTNSGGKGGSAGSTQQDAKTYGRCGVTAVDCNGTCVDTNADRVNCGRCGLVCGSGMVCAGGSCQLTCQPGQVACDGNCVDPRVSPNHCGATEGCGMVPGTASSAGDAAASDSSAKPSVQDAAALGSPGVVCETGQICANSVCRATCPTGQIACEGKCIDPKSDLNFCGATAGCQLDAGTAGVQCGDGQRCSNGLCQVSCAEGLASCGGTCINPKENTRYCGASADCGLDGGTFGVQCRDDQICLQGRCQDYCQSPNLVCDGECINPATSAKHCGASAGCGGDGGSAGVTCAAGQGCISGTCQTVQSVDSGGGDSGGGDSAGGDSAGGDSGPRDASTDAPVTCTAPELICSGSCINPNTSNTHCGATAGCGTGAGSSAGVPCTAPQSCVAGQCQTVTTCAAPTVLCSSQCVDPTSTSTCGATAGCGVGGVGVAGVQCGGTEICSTSTTPPSCACATGMTKCGSTCVDLTIPSASNCGACGATCGTGQTCSGSPLSCQCTSGLKCGSACVDSTTDQNNCGGCGVVCGGGESCISSSCKPGTGADGTLTLLSGSKTINSTAASVTVGSSTNGNELDVVTATSGTFSAGQTILIHQTQTLAGADAGSWELAVIQSVSSKMLTLTKNRTYTYTTDTGNNHAQAIVVPQYTTVTISGGTLTAPAWNGTTGGILALQATGNVEIGGTVTMMGSGYRGANHAPASGCYRCNSSGPFWGTSGESPAGPGSASRFANLSGGGGGAAGHRCAQGGGGSHAGLGGLGYNKVHEFSCGNPTGDSDYGIAVGQIDLTRQMLFGGAGGEGGPDAAGAYPGRGGNGGGIVVILTGGNFTMSGSGKIDVSGDAGGGNTDSTSSCQAATDPGPGGGGGGAGGAVRIVASGTADLLTNVITALGAAGGQCTHVNGDDPDKDASHYYGGLGGEGRINVKAGSTITGTTSPGRT